MFKLVCSLLLLAAAASAHTVTIAYPPGLSAADCPNYPYCGAGPAGAPQAVPAAAAQFPAGVAPAACPNYPFCNTGENVYNYINVNREYPAGVAPAACPNFPYC